MQGAQAQGTEMWALMEPNELRRLAGKVGQPAGDIPAAMYEAAADIERLRTLLARVADEPNIDKARALADAELYTKPNY